MNRRVFGKYSLTALATLALAPTVLLTSCVSKDTLSALVVVLGNAAASLAAAMGRSELAIKLQADTAAAANSIVNWKQGSNSQAIIELLGIVQDDLNLIPYILPYAPLISLAIATAESIIVIVMKNSPAATYKPKVGRRKSTYTGHIPQNASEFRNTWNKIASSDPALTKAIIQ